MKSSILSIILLALMISLNITVVYANLNIAFSIESYLQLRSANVNYHNGDIDIDNIQVVTSLQKKTIVDLDMLC